MGLFDDVFNKQNIYGMLFLNVKAVLAYPTLVKLEEGNKELYKEWVNIARIKHSDFYLKPDFCYETYAVQSPEFLKVVAITYGGVSMNNGEMKRNIKSICNEDEKVVISTFMDDLTLLSSATKSGQQQYPPLCGYNIVAYDIPVLVKRFILLNFNTGKELPNMIKKSLSIKPWESGLIDALNVWKFNGFENTSLQLISSYLGLKKTVTLMTSIELSKYYWENIEHNPKDTLAQVALQSATHTNLVIQLVNKLRTF